MMSETVMDEAGATAPMMMEAVRDGRGWRLRWAVGARRGAAAVTRQTAVAVAEAVQTALAGALTEAVTLGAGPTVRVEQAVDGCLGACAQVTVWLGAGAWRGVVTEPVGERDTDAVIDTAHVGPWRCDGPTVAGTRPTGVGL